jgi:hypothetical protein
LLLTPSASVKPFATFIEPIEGLTITFLVSLVGLPSISISCRWTDVLGQGVDCFDSVVGLDGLPLVGRMLVQQTIFRLVVTGRAAFRTIDLPELRRTITSTAAQLGDDVSRYIRPRMYMECRRKAGDMSPMSQKSHNTQEEVVMRNYGKPVTDDVVREFLPLDTALYSMWMPGDVTTAAIQSTRLNPVRTMTRSSNSTTCTQPARLTLFVWTPPSFAMPKRTPPTSGPWRPSYSRVSRQLLHGTQRSGRATCVRLLGHLRGRMILIKCGN